MIQLKYTVNKQDKRWGTMWLSIGIVQSLLMVYFMPKATELLLAYGLLALAIPLQLYNAYHYLNREQKNYICLSNRKLYITKNFITEPKAYDASEIKALIKAPMKMGVCIESGKVIDIHLKLLSETDQIILMNHLKKMLDMKHLNR